jgi:hypothetical protein
MADYTMISHLTRDKNGDWIDSGSKHLFVVIQGGKVIAR